MATKEEPKDRRHVDREAELAKQQEVIDALKKNEEEQLAAAQEALRRQGVYETTGIRTVEGKP